MLYPIELLGHGGAPMVMGSENFVMFRLKAALGSVRKVAERRSGEAFFNEASPSAGIFRTELNRPTL